MNRIRAAAGRATASARSRRPRRLGFLLAGLLLASTTSVAAADVVSVAARRDNTLFEDATGSLSNGMGPVLFAGNNGQGLARRTLLVFEIAGNVPPGASIDDVVLTLNVSNAPNATPRTFTLHRALADWGEGPSSTTSGSGAPAAENDATWIHTFHASQLWASPGGDFTSTASASQSVLDVGFYSWTGPGMTSDVQAWLDDPAINFGWLMQSDEVTLNTARRFDSRENSVATHRPVLTIHYTSTVGVADDRTTGHVALGPCRPNPAAGRVTTEFSLSRRARARLEVEDLTGRRVATLLDSSVEPGRHEVVWDGQDGRGGRVAAGIYFYRLVVDGRPAATRRLVMMR